MQQRVCRIHFKGVSVRFVMCKRTGGLFVPISDLTDSLGVALKDVDEQVWRGILQRRLQGMADPSAKQRAYLDGRIVPTVSSGFLLMLCHSLSRLLEGESALSPGAQGFGEFRRLIYKSLSAARRRLEWAGPGQAAG